MSADYRLWVNKERTILMRFWDNGRVEIALRDSPSHTWGPPIFMAEEDV